MNKIEKVVFKIIVNLGCWYYSAFLIHVGTTLFWHQVPIVICLVLVATVYAAIYLILWIFLLLLMTLKYRFNIMLKTRKPFKNGKFRFPIVFCKV